MQYFDSCNFLQVNHVDYSIRPFVLRIPAIIDSKINIATVSEPTACKGMEIINALRHSATYYRGFSINFCVTGENMPLYKEGEFFNRLETYNIHGLLNLNKWGETYGYALTKSLNSGLPMLYNNIGSAKERVPFNDGAGPYFKAIDHEQDYTDMRKYMEPFRCFLDYIILNAESRCSSKSVVRLLDIPPVYSLLSSCAPLAVRNEDTLEIEVVRNENTLVTEFVCDGVTSDTEIISGGVTSDTEIISDGDISLRVHL